MTGNNRNRVNERNKCGIKGRKKRRKLWIRFGIDSNT
jgi:hypothetical protein